MTSQFTKKAPKASLERQEDNTEPTEATALEDLLCSQLPPGYTESPMAMDNVSRSWILDFCKSACPCKPGIDDKKCQKATFLRAFLI